MGDVDVVGVVAALRECVQAGDRGGEIVLSLEDGVVEAQGQLQFRRGVGNAGDTDFGEQYGRPAGQVSSESSVAYEHGDASGHLTGAQAEVGQQSFRQIEFVIGPKRIGEGSNSASYLQLEYSIHQLSRNNKNLLTLIAD
ncbi:hypothetical protein [Streptomyces chartreusis]|uniref:hypothetical protein n=1 Tax=Streptomyces chartreusis TaxID=1969 RepID=UPI0033ED7925